MQKIATAGESLKSAGDKVSSTGEKLLPASAAVTALGVAAVKTASDFDSSMSQVAAVSGATGDDFDKLRAKAHEMGAKTKFSASEAADAMNYMAMAGWKTSDMLDGIEGIMNLAAASGEDLATTSDIVTDALTAFGLTAKDSGHFADILAAASSNANTNGRIAGLVVIRFHFPKIIPKCLTSNPLSQIVTSNPRLQPDTDFAVDMFPYKTTELFQELGFYS